MDKRRGDGGGDGDGLEGTGYVKIRRAGWAEDEGDRQRTHGMT